MDKGADMRRVNSLSASGHFSTWRLPARHLQLNLTLPMAVLTRATPRRLIEYPHMRALRYAVADDSGQEAVFSADNAKLARAVPSCLLYPREPHLAISNGGAARLYHIHINMGRNENTC